MNMGFTITSLTRTNLMEIGVERNIYFVNVNFIRIYHQFKNTVGENAVERISI